ncbi:probable mannosyltransferase Ktr2p [Trichomonascus vanleenenianus]|uniref:glycosyltransferase family 15 protein n=1 Tax=Trichomonascus vanleenenianus TaxID=2268995 RepID=UPI003ECA20C1
MSASGGKEYVSWRKKMGRSVARLVFELMVPVGLALMLFSWYLSYSPPAEKEIKPVRSRAIQDLTFNPVIREDRKNRTQIGEENATLFMLVRNEELPTALQTMREMEDRFNRHYRYPWTFLNDKEFTEEFKQLTTGMASGKTEYGLVPKEHWSLPDDVDVAKMNASMESMVNRSVVYGGSLSYRHMCRFNSGFFFQHPLMQKYDYYWRTEPKVHYYCNQEYDPFTFMRKHGKKYGFVITIHEYIDTIPSLWDTAAQFLDTHPEHLAKDSALSFILDKTKLREDDFATTADTDYNLCHFWSNFEIADLNVFRSKAYMEFFEHLDKSRGFFYERWGDAPVHTMGITAFLNRSEIHHFSDIGYFHPPYHRCPKDDDSYASGRCLCSEVEQFHDVDFQSFSCLPKWWKHVGRHFLLDYDLHYED